MISLSRGLLLAALLLGAVLVPVGVARSQDKGGKGGEPVKIVTIDGVELHGMFYPSNKAKAPTVIVLHAIGDSAVNKKLYTSLAETLQPEYSVMLFDFRGHGKSKDVNPQEFWKYDDNRKGIKGGNAKKASIEQGEFNKGTYDPVLCNDIAAVKAYLDRRNDAGDCNTASTILIGAETGATLGAIWLNSQWHLKRMIPNPNNPLLPPALSPTPEGKNVIACIWLSPSSKLGASAVRLSQPLNVAVRGNATATVFMHGDKDTGGKALCDALVTALKVKDDPKYKFITAYSVKGNTNLKGISLIQKTLNTDQVIKDYLSEVVEKKSNEWAKLDFRTSQYMWQVGGPAKTVPSLDANNLLFDNYRKFISGP